MKYYVDTCIWLNYFKKEVRNNVKYWEITKNFLNFVIQSKSKIIVSTIVIKELKFKLGAKFNIILENLRKDDSIILISTTSQDYQLARQLERINNFKLSFYDFLHIAICKRLNISLITRDKDLIKIGTYYIEINKPEDLI
jgi:predicted nucleic acid-binding protein